MKMTKDQVMSELKMMGNENTKKLLFKHGVKEPFFGVKVGDMKTIVKKVKKDYQLSLELYETGNADAQYLAGLIADEKLISKENLQSWVTNASWQMVSEYTVPWIAAESNFGYELALEWIESKEDKIASAGWATLSNLVGIKEDVDLEIPDLLALMERVAKEIQGERNRVKYTMNNFIIASGIYIVTLTKKALKIGEKIGLVKVDMNGTACKVPPISPYIQKVIAMGRIGKKRKMARC